MSTDTSIEWATKTWGPVLGCRKVSAGCDNCYAIRTAHRLAHNPNRNLADLYEGLTARPDDGLDWTGVVRTIPERLRDPLRWRKPERVFVNSQSDLFHHDVPDEFIAQVFAVMALTPQHTYQILTKRHARMRALLTSHGFFDRVLVAANDLRVARGLPEPDGLFVLRMPLPNVWLGVSVENQPWADIRIPALVDTPAAVRWVSAEPLLGSLDLSEYVTCGADWPGHTCNPSCSLLDWVVVGGESGPGARPMHPAWPRELRDQCVAAGVPFFFKQWGAWQFAAAGGTHRVTYGGECYPQRPTCLMSNEETVRRVGKKTSGRLLDGRTWDEYPAVSQEAVPR